MSQVKVFVTDRQRDRRMSFNVPRFRKRRGTIKIWISNDLDNPYPSMALVADPEDHLGRLFAGLEDFFTQILKKIFSALISKIVVISKPHQDPH